MLVGTAFVLRYRSSILKCRRTPMASQEEKSGPQSLLEKQATAKVCAGSLSTHLAGWQCRAVASCTTASSSSRRRAVHDRRLLPPQADLSYSYWAANAVTDAAPPAVPKVRRAHPLGRRRWRRQCLPASCWASHCARKWPLSGLN